MGSIYARGSKLWVGYKDVSGDWRYAPTKFNVGAEAQARKLLDAIERRVKTAVEMGVASLGPINSEALRRALDQG